jgi:peptidoglycan hydrolase-like protein with peptidoglycan-binding domain
LRPIRKGDRGAAAEDVQRRLIALGVDLGPTGVDGVFLGATYAAVRTFQRDHRLDEDGEVGPQTWAALVDATFTLGDRLLYLRFPYLHGEDVRALQGALNSLGFACGEADGIFGAFTEGAVRDFQANTALGADGIVGPDTVRAVEGLRHVWSEKSHPPPVELTAAPSRTATVLRGTDVVLISTDPLSVLAGRIVNLALASEPGARVRLVPSGSEAVCAGALVIELTDAVDRSAGVVVECEDARTLASDFAAAIAEAADGSDRILIVLSEPVFEEHAVQALAVSVLDGLCVGLAASGPPVLP